MLSSVLSGFNITNVCVCSFKAPLDAFVSEAKFCALQELPEHCHCLRVALCQHSAMVRTQPSVHSGHWEQEVCPLQARIAWAASPLTPGM